MRDWSCPKRLKPSWMTATTALVVMFGMAYVVTFSMDSEYDHTMHLSEHISLVEQVHVYRHPITLRFQEFALDFDLAPLVEKRVSPSRVVRSGRTIWEFTDSLSMELEPVPSPNEKLVFLWLSTHDNPWRILDVQRGRTVVVQTPSQLHPRESRAPGEFEETSQVVLRGWSADSRYFYAMVYGTYPDKARSTRDTARYLSYRDLWTVRASDGSGSAVHVCELPMAPGPPPQSWSGTPCDDGAFR